MTIQFNLYNVRNSENGQTVRIDYSLDNHISGRPCVAIRGRTCLEKLTPVFGKSAGVENNSDMMTDYHEDDCLRLFEDHPMYAQARAVAERLKAKRGW